MPKIHAPHGPHRPDDAVLARIREYTTVDDSWNVIWIKKTNTNATVPCIAGWTDERGYRCIRFGNRLIFAHHIVWYLSRGEWPTKSIDHINGIAGDNRPENLREATHAENMRNMRKRNRALPHGVDFHTMTGKYRARIRVGADVIYLGIYSSIEAAAAARINAELKYHGPFASQLGAQAMEQSHS